MRPIPSCSSTFMASGVTVGGRGAQARAGGLAAPSRGRELRAVFMAHLEKVWREPDEGIWEIRGAPQHFVYSKVMTWVAFDRASRAPDTTSQQRAHWKKMARMIHADICKSGGSITGRSRVAIAGSATRAR